MAVAGANQLDIRIADNYRFVRVLARGWCSVVLLASDIETGANVAVKLEEEHGQFHETEVEFYKRLKNSQGIPKMHWSGKEGEFKAIVLDILGPSLQDLHNYCGQQFSRKTVLMLADQLICRLRHIHSKNIIHCDIKPSNCLMGVGREGNTVYLTDFGISRQYEPTHDPATGNGGLIGTTVFASRNAQSGEKQSRRDDMESLGYMLIYLLRGHLPWPVTTTASGPDLNELILERKRNINVATELCRDLPKEFEHYMNHVRNLSYTDAPRYDYLRQLFQRVFKRERYNYDKVFDWTKFHYLER